MICVYSLCTVEKTQEDILSLVPPIQLTNSVSFEDTLETLRLTFRLPYFNVQTLRSSGFLPLTSDLEEII